MTNPSGTGASVTRGTSTQPRLALFNLYTGGHHPEYIAHLVRFWHEWNVGARLEVAAPTSMKDRHPELAALEGSDVTWFAVPEANDLPLLRAGYFHWRKIRDYIVRRRPSHLLLMYFDHAQPGLAMGLRFRFPVRLSGVLFRPTLHYADSQDRSVELTGGLRSLRKEILLRRALQNAHVHTVFSLDADAVPQIKDRLDPACDILALNEPLELPDRRTSPEVTRRLLGIRNDRYVFLFFGVLDQRKGLSVLLEALGQLDDETAARCSIVFAGRIVPNGEEDFRRLRKLREHPHLQLIVHDEFVPYESVQDYFRMADCILAPYQFHVGSSGIVLRAAAESRPVLSQSYGMMGRITRTFKLGVTCDTSSAHALAARIKYCVTNPVADWFDPVSARRFVEANTAEAYAETILRSVLSAGEFDGPRRPESNTP